MRQFIACFLLVILFCAGLALAEMEDFSEAKQLLVEGSPYNQLNDTQFEMIGDYFMDVMTGPRHEAMDAMMGGEGSETLRQFHVNLGRNNYDYYLQTGQLSGMMGGGMMAYASQPAYGVRGGNPANVGYGMMSGSSVNGLYALSAFVWLAFGIVLLIIGVLIIVLLVKKIQGKGTRKRR